MVLRTGPSDVDPEKDPLISQTQLFVGGLPSSYMSDDLTNDFAKFGELKDAFGMGHAMDGSLFSCAASKWRWRAQPPMSIQDIQFIHEHFLFCSLSSVMLPCPGFIDIRQIY